MQILAVYNVFSIKGEDLSEVSDFSGTNRLYTKVLHKDVCVYMYRHEDTCYDTC